MCGIVGYIGSKEATPILLDGLEKLEYRGYDSAGVAVFSQGELKVAKAKGRLAVLEKQLEGGKNLVGNVGIGHTRWATHGEPSDCNSHPHMSNSGRFAIVHNGIIENYLKLKEYLIGKGKIFKSETDTEVVVHLIDHYFAGNILETVIKVLSKIEGSYALGILDRENPDQIVAVRKDSPLIVGLGKGENFIASDVPAILQYTRDIYRLEEGEIVVLKKDKVTVYNTELEVIDKEVERINWDISAAQKGGYAHFMLKEIMEQPKALRDTISPRIKDGKVVLDDITLTKEQIENISKIYIVSCGSSYHVGMVAKYQIEKLCRKVVEVDIASEFRYRNPILDKNTLVIVISQSGETADTKAALSLAKTRGARVLSIVNVVGSSIAHMSHDVIYTWAGPEIAVATTKAYSTQLSVIYLIALYMANSLNTITTDEYDSYIKELESLPDLVEKQLENIEYLQQLASKLFNVKDVFFLGRNHDYAVSLEASLKLKEISYIHSEAYAAGELKHGTISLIEDGTLVIALATHDSLFDKTMSNVKEVKARGAFALGVAQEGKNAIEETCDKVIYVPKSSDLIAPSLAVIPMQVFSYYMALSKGCDIDKPRNLAKSVTVE